MSVYRRQARKGKASVCESPFDGGRWVMEEDDGEERLKRRERAARAEARVSDASRGRRMGPR